MSQKKGHKNKVQEKEDWQLGFTDIGIEEPDRSFEWPEFDF